ncbi:hypothetical protein WJX82_001760 [Trebouxia sp. C0006]
MPHAGSELSEQQAQKEMAFRLNHARQTVEYVQRQAASFGRLDKGKLGIWEALQLVASSQRQRAGHAHLIDDQHVSAVEHAMQTAELCRQASPHQDWFHLVGLIHGLGRLMALPSFGGQPEWAVSSESFPVGCRFSSSITCSHFFSVNPDRRRRLYSSAIGIYQPNCGLAALYMSWSASEYLYLVLLKNKTALPPVARFVLRYCNFLALTRPGDAYSEFLNSTDHAMMPWLRKFQAIQGSGQPSCQGQRPDAELRRYYDSLVLKYIPQQAGWNNLPGLSRTNLSSLRFCRATKVSGIGQSRRVAQLRSKTVAYAGNDKISKLRDKLEAIAKELEAADRESFLSSVAAERAAELAALPIKETTKAAKTQDTAQHKAESHGKLKSKDRKPKKQMKPQVNELEEAEKRPKLFEPAAGPPPKIGEEELQAEGSGHEILLQGFNWESWKQGWYHKLMDQADEFADLGITCIWLPPPTDSVSPQGYMPGDLYNLNSKYGSQEDLKRCVAKLQSKGLKVLCDIVINHRCAQKQDKNGIWNVFGGKMAWDAEAIVVNDRKFKGRGNRATGDEFAAAPNIDHMQDYVRKDLTDWMEWLRDDIGFDGWRFDFVRGYGGQFVREYVLATEPHYVVGEYWDSLDYDGSVPRINQDRHRQQTVDWITAAGGAATAFDVTTKGILHAVFEKDELNRLRDGEGRPPGVMGWWPSRATTFLENHDTGSTQGHWRFPEEGYEQGLVYLMTHPGTPCLFYDDLLEPKKKAMIQKLVALRQKAGINCRSKVNIKHAQKFLYVAEIDGSLLMKIGKAKYEPDSQQWKVLESGKNWGIWQNA